jgi:hypothetical protein
MSSHASLTIRLSGIEPDALTKESLEEKCQGFCDTNSRPRPIFFWGSRKTNAHPLLVSLARHGDSDTGTVTFPSQVAKKRALETLHRERWAVDDTFAHLTVLHSAPEPDLEYAFPTPTAQADGCAM